jgi:hypothetical protein
MAVEKNGPNVSVESIDDLKLPGTSDEFNSPAGSTAREGENLLDSLGLGQLKGK